MSKSNGRKAKPYEYVGRIVDVRTAEDCIRATRKYTEGIVSQRRTQHPIQGDEFPSVVFMKYYEVYPDTELSWDMPAGTAISLLAGGRDCLDILFWYDYRANRASVEIRNGSAAVRKMTKGIPGFGAALKMIRDGASYSIERVSPDLTSNQ